MAVASGRDGRVLARLLFGRPSVHMRTLNTHEVVQIRTIVCRAFSVNGCLSLYKFHWQKATLHYDFQPFRFTQWPFLYSNKDAVCGTLSSYTESEITSHIPRAPSSFPLFTACLQYILPATENWAGAWEQDYSCSTLCESESGLLMITAKYSLSSQTLPHPPEKSGLID